MIDLFNSIDNKFNRYVHNAQHKEFEELIYIFAFIFNPLPVISYLTYIFFTQKITLFIKITLIVLIGLGFTKFLKKYFQKPRPILKNNRKYDFRTVEKNFSMPSGDSLQAALWATVLFIYFNNPYFYVIVPFVMFARCYFHCHFLSDTVVGATLGIAISFLSSYLLDKII